MVGPLKFYNHSQAPNPRRVRIFAAEKGIELALEEIDILAGQTARLDSSLLTRLVRCQFCSSTTVRTSPSR